MSIAMQLLILGRSTVVIANVNCHAIPILKYGAVVVMESAEEGLTY